MVSDTVLRLHRGKSLCLSEILVGWNSQICSKSGMSSTVGIANFLMCLRLIELNSRRKRKPKSAHYQEGASLLVRHPTDYYFGRFRTHPASRRFLSRCNHRPLAPC